MDKKSLDRARGATGGKSGLVSGAQSEIQTPKITPGDQPFHRPAAKAPNVPSNKG